MNLRQKRKHYQYSCRYMIAWYSTNDVGFYISCPKRFLKTLKQKLKINKTYDYDECCRKYFYFEEYHGSMPKFMRDKKQEVTK